MFCPSVRLFLSIPFLLLLLQNANAVPWADMATVASFVHGKFDSLVKNGISAYNFILGQGRPHFEGCQCHEQFVEQQIWAWHGKVPGKLQICPNAMHTSRSGHIQLHIGTFLDNCVLVKAFEAVTEEAVQNEAHNLGKTSQMSHVVQMLATTENILLKKGLWKRLVVLEKGATDLFNFLQAIDEQIESNPTRANEFRLSTRQVCNFGHQIASGLEQMHAKNLVHLDVKMENIVLFLPDDEEMRIGGGWTQKMAFENIFYHLRGITLKLIDLDFTVDVGEAGNYVENGGQGTVRYVSPEFFEQVVEKSRNNKAEIKISPGDDLWALGITLYTLLFWRHPIVPDLFELDQPADVLMERMKPAYGQPGWHINFDQEQIWRGIRRDGEEFHRSFGILHGIIQGTLRKKPAERMSASRVVELTRECAAGHELRRR